MRIGDYELRQTRDRILRDLYQKTEEELNKRKIEIAALNRKYLLEPLQHIIDQLPIELIAHDRQYAVEIKYTPANQEGKVTDENRDQVTVNEQWESTTEKSVINPKDITGSYAYHGGYKSKLDPKLYDQAAKLCDDILILRQEKTTFSNYLVDTTHMYTGSLQLRKVWPESLHKYLPKEPAKLARKYPTKGKKAEVVNPAVPDSFGTRLTTNLLEGK